MAVIDLGTNSVRLDVYRLTGKGVLRVYRDKTMIRLGDGVFSTGRLSKAGMARCLRAFVQYKKYLKLLKVDKIEAFGTSALRCSSNSASFLKLIERTQLGEVLSF